jgi:hypothetical protein
MKNDVEGLLNIGPGCANYLKQISIYNKEDFLKKDPFDIFDELLKINPTLGKPFLASLVGAKENIPWFLILDDVAKKYEKSHPHHQWVKYRK